MEKLKFRKLNSRFKNSLKEYYNQIHSDLIYLCSQKLKLRRISVDARRKLALTAPPRAPCLCSLRAVHLLRDVVIPPDWLHRPICLLC